MNKLLFASLVTALLLVGCSKDEEKKGGSGDELIHVTATLSQSTKTKVDIGFNDGGAEVFWTGGDNIFVFGNRIGGTKVRFGTLTTTITERAKSAKFDGTLTGTSVDGNYYVLYMGTGTTSTNGTSVLLDLTTQTGGISADEYSYLFPYTYMVSAEPGHLDNEDNMVFEMEHLCALLQLNLTLKEAKDGVTLGNIEVWGTNLANKKNLDVYTKVLSDESLAGNKLTLSYVTGPVLSTATTSVALSSFPTVDSEMNVRIYLNDNGTGKYIDVPASQATLEAGKRYTKTFELDLSKAVVVSKKPDVIDYEAKTAEITSSAELVWVSSVTNIGDQDYTDGYNYNGFSGWALTQVNDIDLDGSETKQWIPIGQDAYRNSQPFKGSYDGNGYKIENLYINNTSANQGLFGAVIGSSSNLSTIKGIILSGDVQGGSSVAGILAYASYATISGCVNRANVNGALFVGGIVGTVANTSVNLIACENYGTITGTGNGAGGIIGNAAGIINVIACLNHGTVSGAGSSTNAGGIAAACSAATTVIASCIDEGTVSKTGISAYAGGVVGLMNNYNTTDTKELYFVNNVGLFAAGMDRGGQGWSTQGPSQITDLNSATTIASLNVVIEEWNTNNPDYASPYQFAAGGDDNTIPKLVPIE